MLKVPANFKTLASIAGSDYYIAGWWPGNEQLANKIVAISGNYKEQPLFIYAGNPTNRLHTIHFYRWVSNAIFGSQLAQLKDLEKEQKPSTEVVEIINQKPQAGQATTLRISSTSNHERYSKSSTSTNRKQRKSKQLGYC